MNADAGDTGCELRRSCGNKEWWPAMRGGGSFSTLLSAFNFAICDKIPCDSPHLTGPTI